MKLPRAAEAVIDIAKLRDYCLSRTHARGRHKARVFFAALGIGERHAEQLSAALKQAVEELEATPGLSDQFGTRYVVDFIWEIEGRSARIRSSWILPLDETAPRFITCFVL
jgi:hypothetical protein